MNETIMSLKERIAVKEGIIMRQNDIILRLSSSNSVLRDDLTLTTSGIHEDSLLLIEVVPRNVCTLFIKTLNGRTFILYPLQTVLVSHIKADLAEKSNIPVNQQRLVYQGSDLPDNQTLVQCGVPTHCTLHVIQTNPPVAVPNKPKLPLLVKTLVGKAITVYIGEGDKVCDIKKMISTREGYPMNEIVIMMGGVELGDDEVLDYLQIQQGSTLLVTFKVKDKLKLQVYNVSHSKTMYMENVHFTDTVGDVVNRLSMDMATPPNAITLVHKGQVLRHHVTIEQCEMTEDTIVSLHLLKPKSVFVSVATVTGQAQCCVNLSSFECVSALKSAIEASHGVSGGEQVLVYRGKRLEEHMYICDCMPSSMCTVKLFTQTGINRNISVKVLPVGRVTQQQLPTETTIDQIRKRISEEYQVTPQQISMMYNGIELQPMCCLGDYLILDGAQIVVTVHSHEAMAILIQPDNNQSAFTLTVDGVESVRVLKLRVASQLSVSVDGITLCYCGIYLTDDRLVHEYRLPDTCIILAEVQP